MIKRSIQRELIRDNLTHRTDHPTADMVYQSIREELPNISLGTVYRNLSLLTSLGKIMKITCENTLMVMLIHTFISYVLSVDV